MSIQPLSNRALAGASKVSNSTVGEYLRRAEVIEISWPLPEGLSEEGLYSKLFPETDQANAVKRPTPDSEMASESPPSSGSCVGQPFLTGYLCKR